MLIDADDDVAERQLKQEHTDERYCYTRLRRLSRTASRSGGMLNEQGDEERAVRHGGGLPDKVCREVRLNGTTAMNVVVLAHDYNEIKSLCKSTVRRSNISQRRRRRRGIVHQRHSNVFL